MFRRRRRRLPENAEAVFRRHVREWEFLTDDERGRLAGFADELLATKSWEAARGFELTDQMCTAIAANASLLVLGRDLELYRHVRAVVVHPSVMTLSEPRPGPVAGLYDDSPVHLDGLAHHAQGPVVLAWDAVRRETVHRSSAMNVVIHEFAHKLDMLDGQSDGAPAFMGPVLADRWRRVAGAEFELLRRGGDGPEEPYEPGTGHRAPEGLIRDYAATDRVEFFAVCAEVFFVRPTEFAAAKPELYGLYAEYLDQDPAGRRSPG